MSLKTVNLSKRFKDKWVLRDVSIEATAGEVLGIFGPSGSGKTVLLDAIAGEYPLNGGSVSSSEVVTAKRRPSLWSRIFGSNGSPAVRVGDAIENAKSVLLLDEPFCVSDMNERAKEIEQLRTAALERGLVVVLASSDYRLLFEACDTVAILVGGEIRQVGTPREVYEQPASRIVASVTGPNNLFAARRLTSSKAEIPEFHTIDGGHRLFAQRIDSAALGALNQNVTLGIRPENISISFGASFPADNLLKATVTKIQFLGSTTMIGLDAGGLSLDVLVLRLVGLNVGDECMVGLPPERILIFRD
jgi:ABC-type Fe3+/spermidine/putrescine transport system ATPase subunit